MTLNLKKAVELSNEFSTICDATFTRDEYRAIVDANKRHGLSSGICATHDYCDANMLMDAAFTKVMGREADVSNEDDALLWSVAWTISNASDFQPR